MLFEAPSAVFNRAFWRILDLSCENKSSSGITQVFWKPLFCSARMRLGNVFILLQMWYFYWIMFSAARKKLAESFTEEKFTGDMRILEAHWFRKVGRLLPQNLNGIFCLYWSFKGPWSLPWNTDCEIPTANIITDKVVSSGKCSCHGAALSFMHDVVSGSSFCCLCYTVLAKD